ncbi:MAG: FtsX-like permease family protein [Fimbriimonas sp.]|nr:FtsX-like permease family protein [Fimbriimonas sp.]
MIADLIRFFEREIPTRTLTAQSIVSLKRIIVGILFGSLACLAMSTPTDDQIKQIYRQLLPQVRLDRIQRDYRSIAELGSRLAGSTGEANAFDYAEATFRSIGAVNIHRETFRVTVPDPDAVGHLAVSGHTVDVLPLWPNLVRTSTCDINGPIIYGGNGSLEALRGMDIVGAVVVEEFGVGAAWKNAAKLGAAAIVFIEPGAMPRGDAENKFSAVPLSVPRFYLPIKVSGPVLQACQSHQTVRLSCRQDWVGRTSCNLIADLPGNSPAQNSEPIALEAYADSMSIVPKLAPGAESIGGLATLLEAARVFSVRPHARPLRLIVSGAHFLALQGAREYVQKRMDTNDLPPLLCLTLDLSSGSRSIGSYARGWFYDYRDEEEDNVRQLSRLFRAHAEKLAEVMDVSPARVVLVDAVNNGDDRTWKNNIPGKFALDCEPILTSGMNALTLMTVEDSRERVDTPFDTIDRVDISNVRRQAQTVAAMLHHALNDTIDRSETSDYRLAIEAAKPVGMRLTGGFASVAGKVVIYDPNKSFVPDTPVSNSIAAVLATQKTMMGVRGDMLQGVDDKADYRIVGVAPKTAYSDEKRWITRLAAFHLDPVSGNIDYAPSWGTYGDETYRIEFPMKTSERSSPLVVFHCASIDLYDLVDPQDLQALQWVWIGDSDTGAHPQDYGVLGPGFDTKFSPEIEDTQVIFVKPDLHFFVLAQGGPGAARLILTHSKLGNEAGEGYVSKSGRFANLPLHTAEDIVAINATRLARFKKYRIISPSVLELHKQAEQEIAAAKASQAARDWPEAERHARAAWGLALRAHPVLQSTANDVVNGVIFYLFLLIPFSYFMERLLVGNQLLSKQLGFAVAFFIGAFLLLRLIHPAFEIVSNPAMIFVAFVMGTLSLIVMSFILGKFEASLKVVRQAQSGVHEVDIKRSSVAMAAFNLGVSNMRRRKARTILTTLTLVVMTFIVLSFTSIVQELTLNEYASNTVARYPGILLRNPGLDPMQLAMYRQLTNEFSGRAVVVRRAAYYGADIGTTGVLTLQRADRSAEVNALAGFEPDETKVMHPQDALLPGGRWFRPGERDAMILPQRIAQQLKIDPDEVGKAKVSYAGVDYTVVGIIDSGFMRSLVDLDGDGIMPADFSLSNKYQQESASTTKAFRSYLRLDPSSCFILPTETALSLGADIRNMAVAFETPAQTRKALDTLMPRLRINLYGSVPNGHGGLEVRQFSVFESSKGVGLGLVFIQLIIASVFVLNTMVASVYERTKEIAIFSSIGLAPNHIAMLFFAESLVYGVLGAVIGYFVAQTSAKIIVSTGALPGLTLNFSSTSAVMSATIVMAVVLASTIYPARKASEIAAPAMNEEVFETEPDGDLWDLPLPFSINATEAGPLIRFLGEWLKAYEEYTIGDFVTANTKTEAETPADGTGTIFRVSTVAWLAPYDLGISQTLLLTASPAQVPGVYLLDLKLGRIAGDPENWPIVNQRFLANLRKQFLTWRTLGPELRRKYSVD